MYGRIAACAAAAAALGFLSGAAAMTDYVDDQSRGRSPDSAGNPGSSEQSIADGFPGADHAVRAVGAPLTQRACEWATVDEVRGVPLAHQLSAVPVVTINAIGGLTGGGECSLPPA